MKPGEVVTLRDPETGRRRRWEVMRADESAGVVWLRRYQPRRPRKSGPVQRASIADLERAGANVQGALL